MRKRMMTILLCSLLAMAVIGFAAPADVFACSCAAPPSVQSEMNRKTAIFAGKVKDVKQPGKIGFAQSSADPVRVTFEVTTVWKGQVASTTEVYTAMSSASCGYTGFAVNQSYLVSAYGTSDRLETGMCEMTKPLSAASLELAELGTGQAPDPSKAVAEGSYIVPAVAAVSVLVLAAAAALFVMSRRRRT
ncbi:hypothetical protein [Paenibacillus oceani]|uniref:Tissue inhibitor of metalloproteinase n=1 Tax=Paenibacillus oceani TaxID=2772510 RepID=A0A927GXR1_9BACL|nr:hypothetical protein [Paenibacillus oceani]MBD2860795.1 hypothetical protein [Paenibacillus oceani]